jgi:outer membrane immunogenic protein
VGYAADRVLFYATAGGVFGSIQTTFAGVGNTTTHAGWTAGAGIEVAVVDNWTAKVEYLYADLGTANVNCTTACVATLGFSATASVGLTANLVRVGVNYKFPN